MKIEKKYQIEKNARTHTNELVEVLCDYYVHDDAAEELKDLERKLTEAEKTFLLEKAKRYKHSFRTKVERYRLFTSAQQIYALLLGQALTRFEAYVEPALGTNISSGDLKVLIEENVVNYLLGCIPDAEPTVDSPTIHGMIYFLTGNCFIDWVPE